jgi:hypothetical protein
VELRGKVMEEFNVNECSHWVVFFQMDKEEGELHINHLIGYEELPTVEDVNSNIEDLREEVGDVVEELTHTVLTTKELKEALPEFFEA